MQKGSDFLNRATENGTNLDAYHGSGSVKKTIDLYFEKLSDFVSKQAATSHTKQVKKSSRVKPEKKAKTRTKKGTVKVESEATDDSIPILVERIPEEVRFIKRYVNLHGKVKEKDDLLRFINSLQKSILEKRIRKTSEYAEQIKYMQDRLIEAYNTMKGKVVIEIKPDIYEAMKKLAGGEKVLPTINFIKRYIGMNGKPGMKEKAKLLLSQIDRAYEKGKVNDSDAYIVELHQVKKNLRDFISDKGVRTLNIEKATLYGLQGILNGCNCIGGLGGLGAAAIALPPVMNSMDFANVRFKTLGFKGKWRELIGDPSTTFTAMVFGKPKMGKSYLCVEFAGYLARNHGRVLFVAKEEGLDMTLQEKLNDKNVKHPNLFVASVLPESLVEYDFVFLDSVNRLGLTPEDLQRLKAFNSTKSFVFVFQSTKQGNFRGDNSFQHDVDVVIEVLERGKAVQMGRFNQGGEMEIFQDDAISDATD